MFKHIFITRLKCLIREKSLVFWTLLFPIALGTFFNLAFSNLDAAEKFEPVNLGVVNNEAYNSNQSFKELITSLSKEDDNKVFNTKYVTLEEAKNLLDDNKISGYIVVENTIDLHIKSNGFNQTIIKSVIDNYLQISSALETIITLKPEVIKKGIIEEISKHQEYIEDTTSSNMNTTVVYFYSLIGMVCMYAGFWGIKTVNESQANLSALGARANITPVHKGKILIYSLLASILVQFIEVLIILGYLIFALHIDFGDQTLYVLLISLVGCIAGISFGAMISSITTKSENLKIGILMSVSMTFSFLAGMMYLDMRYIIATNVPLLGYINPVNLITDALYSLYYYTTYNRFFMDFIILGGLSIIFCFITYIFIRRRRYESI